MILADLDAAAKRAETLAVPGGRSILGIVGCPGAGKSTVAAHIVAALGPERAVLVPMDGFHLANVQLSRLGRADRKGAPDTFDVDGYAALLHRLRRSAAGEVVYAPEFRRDLEESIGGAIAVPGDVPLVVTEGNYLLHRADGWQHVGELLDETWFVDVDDERRVRQLIARHVRFGKPPDEARAWVERSDEANAVLIHSTRHFADAFVRYDQ